MAWMRKEKREPVHFGAGAAKTAAPGTEISVRFAAYAPTEQRQARKLLAAVSGDAEARGEYSETTWAIGTVATVVCFGAGLNVTPPRQNFTWQGQRTHLDFDVTISSTTPTGTATRIKFDGFVDGIVVARLRVGLDVIEPDVPPTGRNEVTIGSARTAFASYASPDRERVLDRVASVRAATGLEVWMDCVNLRPNDRWRELLGPEIEARDLFLLFWSTPAAQSEWVDWEWRAALAKKGLDGMQLHPLENVSTLPAELKPLHSTDPLMDIRAATLARNPSTK